MTEWTSQSWFPPVVASLLAFSLSYLSLRLSVRSWRNRLVLLEDDVAVLSDRVSRLQKRNGGDASVEMRARHLAEAQTIAQGAKTAQNGRLTLPGRVNG